MVSLFQSNFVILEPHSKRSSIGHLLARPTGAVWSYSGGWRPGAETLILGNERLLIRESVIGLLLIEHLDQEELFSLELMTDMNCIAAA